MRVVVPLSCLHFFFEMVASFMLTQLRDPALAVSRFLDLYSRRTYIILHLFIPSHFQGSLSLKLSQAQKWHL